MTGAARGEQMFDYRNGMGRGHADGFVEHEPAVDVTLWSLDASGLRGGRGLAVTIGGRAVRRIHALETIISSRPRCCGLRLANSATKSLGSIDALSIISRGGF